DQHRGWYMLGQQNIAGDLFRVLWSPRIASVYAVVCGRRPVARAVWGREIHAIMAAGGEPAVYLVLTGKWLEQVDLLADRFGTAQEQKARVLQLKTKQRDQASLRFSRQIDEQIATADQIQPRIGRIVGHALRRKHDVFAQAALDLIVLVDLVEKRAQALVGQNRLD